MLVVKFIKDIISQKREIIDLSILISTFSIELIMIFVFLEIIEINFCGLNKNLKRNIESRGIIDSALINEENYDERSTIN